MFSLYLIRMNTVVWGLYAIAGTLHSTAKGMWPHKKASKIKLAGGYLSSLPASLGSSSQIQILQTVSGSPALSQCCNEPTTE